MFSKMLRLLMIIFFTASSIIVSAKLLDPKCLKVDPDDVVNKYKSILYIFLISNILPRIHICVVRRPISFRTPLLRVVFRKYSLKMIPTQWTWPRANRRNRFYFHHQCGYDLLCVRFFKWKNKWFITRVQCLSECVFNVTGTLTKTGELDITNITKSIDALWLPVVQEAFKDCQSIGE